MFSTALGASLPASPLAVIAEDHSAGRVTLGVFSPPTVVRMPRLSHIRYGFSRDESYPRFTMVVTTGCGHECHGFAPGVDRRNIGFSLHLRTGNPRGRSPRWQDSRWLALFNRAIDFHPLSSTSLDTLVAPDDRFGRT
jgi:hypothetical protein